jgi:hypothetical protein
MQKSHSGGLSVRQSEVAFKCLEVKVISGRSYYKSIVAGIPVICINYLDMYRDTLF